MPGGIARSVCGTRSGKSGRKASLAISKRTLGGAAISIGCIFFALLLFAAEFSSYRAIETTDRLAVDTSTPSDGKLDINLDIYFPSLPCAELVTDVVDESGSQQLAVTDTLHKLRVDRNGVPIDIPQPVHWGQEVAPAFGQRKTVALMEEARRQLADTLSHLDHEAEENPELSAAQLEAHRAELAEHAALINGRLSRLTAAALTISARGVTLSVSARYSLRGVPVVVVPPSSETVEPLVMPADSVTSA